MLTASDAYKAAILPGTSAYRKTVARVTLNVSEATVTYSNWAATNSEAGFSDVTKVTDGKLNTYRVATCEPNYWKLDGSTIFNPATAIDVGYASLALSLADGTFTANPAVVLTTSAKFTSKGITLFFDQLSGDYPIEFDIDVTNGATSVYHKAVTDNASAYYALDEDINAADAACDTITITFKKMNKAYRRARLAELFLGFQQVYGIGGSDDMISVKTIQQIDITNKTLPYGQATLRILDLNDDFNPLDPSGIAEDLQSGAEMKVEHGVYVSDGVIEYVKTGTYLFKDWRDVGGKNIELNGKDTLGYYGSLKAVARYNDTVNTYMPQSYLSEILSHAGIPAAKYDISDFPDVISSTGFMECLAQPTIAEELLMMAQWLCKVCVVDEDGVIKFIDIGTVSVDDIDLDDCYDDPVIEKNERIAAVDVYVYSQSVPDPATYTHTFVVQETITGSKTVYIWLENRSFGSCGLSSTGAISATYTTSDYGYMPIDVVGDGSEVTLTFSIVEDVISRTLYTLDNTDPGSGGIRILINNPHVCTETKAAEIAAWTLANYNKLLKFDHSFRGNPLLEMGDLVTAETVHGDASEIVTRQDITFNGTMSATMEGVS